MIWSDERVEELKKLWDDEGLSAAQIAERWDCTRNTVCGKLNRLGMYRNSEGERRQRRETHAKPTAVPKSPFRLGPPPKPAQLVPHDPANVKAPTRPKSEIWKPIEGSTPRPFHERPKAGCKWPVSVDAETMACSILAVRGGYCAEHASIALRPEPPPSANETMRALRRYVS